MIRVDIVRIHLLNRRVFLYDRKLRRKVIFNGPAVELYVKRHLLRKHFVLIKIEHIRPWIFIFFSFLLHRNNAKK